MKHTLEERIAKARELRAAGYNCAQCVLLSFDDVMPDGDTSMLARAASGFGSGIGASGEICGAISGSVMILGIVREGVTRPDPSYSTPMPASAQCSARLLKRV